ncbi:hypothetical protein FAUST_11784 [Fusarium austroamericanum]|uniref:Linoleate diol synthase n=1 Tax=Fusarium austroamericanum TaxID=282268 RepID=A0AAN5Z0T1_FUSAU|nr:hypothetical protein FAUST_11784 [Fusarium austroamericanum]
MNGHSQNGHSHPGYPHMGPREKELLELTLQLRDKAKMEEYAKFHGDKLINNPTISTVGLLNDLTRVLSNPSNWPAAVTALSSYLRRSPDGPSLALIGGTLANNSAKRQEIINSQVKKKYDVMLHPPLTYLGDAFQYRTADGKFNSALNPHLGQAGAPYAKTVPSTTAPLGALPDPSDIFDKLMARDKGRQSKSGFSSMLIYHATIIIHDIFRTNDNDKNISDSSSYLDLSPLYGYTDEMVRKVRDDKYGFGLLKPDTFAEDRLLRQPPGVCIILVMYNRYHNYAARQLYRINENGRFRVPTMYEETQLVSLIKMLLPKKDEPLLPYVQDMCKEYERLSKKVQAARPKDPPSRLLWLPDESPEEKLERENRNKAWQEATDAIEAFEAEELYTTFVTLAGQLEKLITDKARGIRTSKDLAPELAEKQAAAFEANCKKFEKDYDAAWKKLDDDLFQTARLITCGMYIQISIHDYLRGLMGFNQFNTNFTLDPTADFDQKKTTRGLGNQVTVEFNLLYRFHCAISLDDEEYTEEFMRKVMQFKNPKNTSLLDFIENVKMGRAMDARNKERNKIREPWEVTFGIPEDKSVPENQASSSGNSSDSGIAFNNTSSSAGDKGKRSKFKNFVRNPVTNLFDDKDMLDALTKSMDDPISNFGPCNVPKCLKPVEIMGIIQARKWQCGTLNDFRDFFDLPRHTSFESVTKNTDVQNALRDLYDSPDKIELYPGIFCESDAEMGLDPGPSQSSSALWSAIFSDAITLVRSDRFYTVDWNTNSLTSWGMKEVTPNNDICKSSVFHRLLQRAFPGWFPSNTIRFFHPFFTAEQNAKYAEAQGYKDWFKETVNHNDNKPVVAASVQKPEKPLYLRKYDDIQKVLMEDNSGKFTNPAYYYQANLPTAVRQVVDPERQTPPYSNKINEYVLKAEKSLSEYLNDLMKDMIKREAISMTTSTFQIDATRDFAIPVVTHYVAEFLGFGDKLVVDPIETKGLYAENEIYQHITNCQVFLSYSADETKWMQRRLAFRESMETLVGLTLRGTIWEANQWDITSLVFGKKKSNAMHDLGVFVAKEVLAYEKDQSKAAAILLLVCLDFAYNAVVSFTATLDGFMKDLYAAAAAVAVAADADDGSLDEILEDLSIHPPKWIQVQKYAFSDDPQAKEMFLKVVQKMVQSTVQQPIYRKVREEGAGEYTFDGKDVTLKEGQAIILDMAEAIAEVETDKVKTEFLMCQLNISDKYGVFSPQRFATISLTSMIKFVAQMRNPRRGHDTQGHLKKINLDPVYEGYANFMARKRVKWIEQQVNNMDNTKKAKAIFTDKVLRPKTDTYLTPSWDEFVPFPMTWKIRFDGFGESNYADPKNPYGKVVSKNLSLNSPPWYQPQGPSDHGGAFAGTVCVCAPSANKEVVVNGQGGDVHQHNCPCVGGKKEGHQPLTVQLSTGCGFGGQ